MVRTNQSWGSPAPPRATFFTHQQPRPGWSPPAWSLSPQPTPFHPIPPHSTLCLLAAKRLVSLSEISKQAQEATLFSFSSWQPLHPYFPLPGQARRERCLSLSSEAFASPFPLCRFAPTARPPASPLLSARGSACSMHTARRLV